MAPSTSALPGEAVASPDVGSTPIVLFGDISRDNLTIVGKYTSTGLPSLQVGERATRRRSSPKQDANFHRSFFLAPSQAAQTGLGVCGVRVSRHVDPSRTLRGAPSPLGMAEPRRWTPGTLPFQAAK
jgi:hypothetical protein